MKLDFDVVIVGAGVAGMTAALYLKRAGISCCILESMIPGGQINRTSTIENYPGFENIKGPDLANAMFEQIKKLGVEYRYGDVIEIVDAGNEKIVKTANEGIHCNYVIIATGRSPKKLNIKGEEELTNRGLSWCAICDGPLYRNKNVAVIGGGNSAVEEALYLSNICANVTLISRSDTLRAQRHLVEMLKQKGNVTIRSQKTPLEFKEKENRLSSILMKDNLTNEYEELQVEGCFIYIGQIPNTAFLENLEIREEDGYIKTDERQETKIKNIYAIGDVTKKNLYQIVTATAEGAIAANAIIGKIG